MNPESSKLIYTLGTSTRPSKEFIELLSNHDVAVVMDVRRFPSSRFEHFRKEKLEALLLEAGIDYIYMGEELGGYRRGGYKGFMDSSQFQTGLSKLEEVARRKRAAIVCAEQFPCIFPRLGQALSKGE
jgi:uncharacterized protein (DUF488 family)